VRRNIFVDGLFNLFALGLTFVGVGRLWCGLRAGAAPLPRRNLPASIAMGWGLFNLVEGTIDHHLLELHHVRPGPDQLFHDLAFLLVGALLVFGGSRLSRATPRGAEARA
jgi:uncharacterized membrane protein